MSYRGKEVPSSLDDQSAFNNIMRTIQEQSEENQHKLQAVLEKMGNNYANNLEEASKVCNTVGRMFAPEISDIITHSASVFQSDSAEIRKKYDNVVQMASKLKSAIKSSQAEACIVLRTVEKNTDPDSESLKVLARKVMDESKRIGDNMMKHIKEYLPDPSSTRKSRTGNRRSHSSYARPGTSVRPSSGVRQQKRPSGIPSAQKMKKVQEARSSKDAGPELESKRTSSKTKKK